MQQPTKKLHYVGIATGLIGGLSAFCAGAVFVSYTNAAAMTAYLCGLAVMGIVWQSTDWIAGLLEGKYGV